MSRFPNQKKLYSSTNEQLAWNVHNLLTNQGFHTTVQNESLPDLVVPRLIAPFEVWVRDAEYDDAVIALQKITAGDHANSAGWICGACGEKIEGQFTDCWKCGRNR